ncbi:hypothetical protein, partial [Thiolapillus sp.]|uniref:hypothetical protein n=1 Tax=Thiolapillus sp. TaxID=2017437 RepID=UPI003AF69FFF
MRIVVPQDCIAEGDAGNVGRLTEIAIVIRLGVDAIDGIGGLLKRQVIIKRVFGLVIDFGTSQSPKSTRPLTTYWCPSRPGHQALRNN